MNSATGRPWDGIELWGSHKQFRETLTEAEEAEFDDYLDEAREEDLEERRAEIENDFPDLDLDAPIPDDLFQTLPDEDLDRLIDWQYDNDILDEERDREASAKEFAEAMADIGDAAPSPSESEERPEFGPPRPLTAQQRFEIGFRTTGLITPEMREWEIAADRALSEQFGQQVVGQWVFGMSDPMLHSAGEELPEDAEVIGPAGDDHPGGRMIRIPTARRKYRIAEDGTFLGQFAYDDRQAESLLYVTFSQNPGTANIPVSYGVLVDVSTDRIFNVSTSRAPKEVMDAVRADNDGGLYIDNLLDQPDPRWLAAEPKTLEESMALMAERLAPKGLVAEWVNDPDHVLNPTARANRRDRFRPVLQPRPDAISEPPAATLPDSEDDDLPEPETRDDSPPEDDGSTVEEVFGPPPQHIQDLDNMPDRVAAEVNWGDGESLFDDDDPPEAATAEPVSVGTTPPADTSFLSGKVVIFLGIAVVIIGAVVISTLMGGSDVPDDVAASPTGLQSASTSGDQTAPPADATPANDGEAGQADGAPPEQPAPATEARTPDGQVPELPTGWAAPPAFETFATDVGDPTVRYSSGGSLWAWSIWAESELISEQTETEGDFSVTQIARIPVGTAIPNEFIISVDCSTEPCRYSTIYNAVVDEVVVDVPVDLSLDGLALTGEYTVPRDTTQVEACTATGRYELEVTDLTVINNRLVPDYIRGTRTLNQECGEYELREVIDIAGRYLFRGSFADQ